MGRWREKKEIRTLLASAYHEIPLRDPAPGIEANTRLLCFAQRRGLQSATFTLLDGPVFSQSSNSASPVVASSADLAGAVDAFTAGVSVLGSSKSLHAILTSEEEFQRLIKALDQSQLLLFVSSCNTERLLQAKQVLEFSNSIDNDIVAYTVGGNPYEQAKSVRLASQSSGCSASGRLAARPPGTT